MQTKKNKIEPVKTVLTITLGFTVIYLFTMAKWILITALIIGLAGLFSTYLAGKIHFLWMKLALVLSYIIPNIILGIIFFLVLFPMSLFQKLFSKRDHLMLKNNSDSTFITVDKTFSKESFKKPW
jgi:cytochrome c oxidase subunit IV